MKSENKTGMKVFLNYKNRNFRLAAACFILLAFHFSLFSLTLVEAHRYHTSLTRMDYNAKEKSIETSIQLFTHDLAPILEQRTKRKIDLEKTTDIDKVIFDYLSENFVLKNEKGETQKIKWIGKEVEIDTAWVYLEISSDKSPENFTLQNTLFFESFPEQTNLVIARFDDKKADLLFKVGDRVKEIKQNAVATENKA